MSPVDPPDDGAAPPPRRALIPLHNRAGRALRPAAARRWMAVARVCHKAVKADFFHRAGDFGAWAALVAEARAQDLAPALRTCAEAPPPDLAALRDAGLLDLFLSPRDPAPGQWRAWVDAAAAAGLPVRLQFAADARLAELDAAALDGVIALKPALIQVRADDPLQPAGRDPEAAARAGALAIAADAAGIPVLLIDIPPEQLPAAARRFSRGAQSACAEPDHYTLAARALAERLYPRAPWIAETVLLALLSRRASRLSQVDNFILARTLHVREGLLDRLAAWHKRTRLSGVPRGVPKAIEEWDAPLPPRGARDPASTRTVYRDAVDLEMERDEAGRAELAAQARRVIAARRFDREITPGEYGAENAHVLASPGANRWCSIANVEKRGTPLGQWDPPVTFQVTIGGGHAEYAGFAFGDHARVLCPMDLLQHTLTLHVAADGAYVLLRDGAPARPVEFAGAHFAPRRLATRLDPRLALWNIDKDIFTQSVLVWEGGGATPTLSPAPRYSVVIVATRYARRLQAALLALARQRDFDPAQLEVLVAYVPGLDATDDVIDSLAAAQPALRVIRSPFAESDFRAKGRLINETARLARGAWLVLLDADTVLLPQTFAAFERHAERSHFMAPDGRKMLDPAATARILLGLCDPAGAWEELLAGPGEWRRREADGMPIGFCQAVRRDCFDAVRYEEHGHFEGADWRFARAVRERFGSETWLEGIPALHLDHGSSNWYGATRHF